MKKELEGKFRERWPAWFADLYGDPSQTCMAWGFTHDDGWFDLVWGLCEKIEALGPEATERFKVEQVKEKFGGLRIYTSGGNEAIRELIHQADIQSFHICEICGEPGVLRGGSWLQTLCDVHAKGKEAYV